MRHAACIASIAAAILAAAAPVEARPSSHFFGVNLGAIPTSKDAERMAHGGITVARFPFDWRATQPHRHSGYDWRVGDSVAKALASAHVRLLPILYGSAPWVHNDYRRPPLQPASNRRAWRRMVRAAVSRYGPNGPFWRRHPNLPYLPVNDWQVWNEPNIPGFFAPKASPGRYTRLLKITSAAIREADPNAKVVLGGLTRGSHLAGQIPSASYLAGLYEHGAAQYFDVLAIHPFAPGLGGVRFQIRHFRKVSERYGDGNKPLWIDEFGWPTGHDSRNPLAVGRKEQAHLLTRTLNFVLDRRRRFGIRFVEWVLWRDKPDYPGCLFCRSGLLHESGGRARPAWAAYKSFAQR